MGTDDRPFATASLPAGPDTVAVDGSQIRLLVAGERGSMAHGTLSPGQVSRAIAHRTVDEVWYVLGGRAELWRRLHDIESTEQVAAGDAVTIPRGTSFQYRTLGDAPFAFVMCTIPPWPGDDEALLVEGRWGS